MGQPIWSVHATPLNLLLFNEPTPSSSCPPLEKSAVAGAPCPADAGPQGVREPVGRSAPAPVVPAHLPTLDIAVRHAHRTRARGDTRRHHPMGRTAADLRADAGGTGPAGAIASSGPLAAEAALFELGTLPRVRGADSRRHRTGGGRAGTRGTPAPRGLRRRLRQRRGQR